MAEMAVFELVKVPEPSEPHESATLVHRLREWCQRQPNKTQLTWLDDAGREEVTWTYRDLEMRADAVCHALHHLWGCEPSDRAALMYLPGLDFIAAFWGCLFAGVVAVPVYPVDLRGDKFEVESERFGRIVAACEAQLVLSHRSYLQLKRLYDLKNALVGTACWPEGLQFHATDGLEPCGERHGALPSPEQLAFLQFTSGSTGDPKGVMLSHGNILHNTSTIASTFDLQSEDTAVSWLPQYHDMGLIGYFLLPASIGGNTVFMSPMTFLLKPGLWLSTISLHKATYLSAPNFAFQRCVDKLQDILREYPMESLALGQLKGAMNAAEPIRPSTLRAFAESYSAAGFRPEQWACSYGLAENVIYVSGFSHKPVLLVVQRNALDAGLIVPSEALDDGCVELVACGKPWPGCGIGVKIVDTQTLADAAPDQVGEIWVSGPSKAQGYWGKPELSRETFKATIKDDPTGTEYLRTGDLGFIHEGELYVCGRLKDLIIVCGRNVYPQDVERSAEGCHKSLRPGCSAAFGVDCDAEEQLVLVGEVRGRPSEEELLHIIKEVKKAVSHEHQLQFHAVLLLKERTVPKTTSGKIRRKACKEGFFEWQQYQQAAAAGDATTSTRSRGWWCCLNDAWSTPTLPAALDVLAHWISKCTDGDARVQSSSCVDRELVPEIGPSGLNIKRISSSQAQMALKLLVEQQVGCTVEVDDQLMQMGLTSTKIFNVISGMQETYNVEVPVSAVFEYPTIRELAEHIAVTTDAAAMAGSTLSQVEDEGSMAPGRRLGEEESLPLTPMQERMWILYEQTNHTPRYNVSMYAQFRGELDPMLIQYAFNAVVDRHETLRTLFTSSTAGAPLQRIVPAGAWTVPTLPSIQLEPSNRQTWTHGTFMTLRSSLGGWTRCAVMGECNRQIDLAMTGPLSYRVVQPLSIQDFFLVLSVHHIAIDGFSLPSLLESFSAAYNKLSTGRLAELAELPMRYADWAGWYTAKMDRQNWSPGSGRRCEKDLKYWRETLRDGDLPVLGLSQYSHDSLSPLETDISDDNLVDIELSAGLQDAARAVNATPMNVTMAAWAVLLCHRASQDEVVIGFPYANRESSQLVKQVGLFMTTFAAVVAIEATDDFQSVVKAARTAVTSALSHRFAPFRSVVQVLTKLQRGSRRPVYQTLLFWTGGFLIEAKDTLLRESQTVAGLEVLDTHFVTRSGFADLGLHLGPIGNVYRGFIGYDRTLLKSDTVPCSNC